MSWLYHFSKSTILKFTKKSYSNCNAFSHLPLFLIFFSFFLIISYFDSVDLYLSSMIQKAVTIRKFLQPLVSEVSPFFWRSRKWLTAKHPSPYDLLSTHSHASQKTHGGLPCLPVTRPNMNLSSWTYWQSQTQTFQLLILSHEWLRLELFVPLKLVGGRDKQILFS